MFVISGKGVDQRTVMYEGHLGSLVGQQTQAYELIKIDCKDIRLHTTRLQSQA